MKDRRSRNYMISEIMTLTGQDFVTVSRLINTLTVSNGLTPSESISMLYGSLCLTVSDDLSLTFKRSKDQTPKD